MGVLPLEFEGGETRETLDLTGRETYDVEGIAEGLAPGKVVAVRARDEAGGEKRFRAKARIDTPDEMEAFRHGGLLPFVLRTLAVR